MKELTHLLRHGGSAMVSSLINLILRLIRIKLLALFLGPAGVGQIGLLSNFIDMVGTLVGTGFSGTLNRELARQKDRKQANQLIVAAALLFGVCAAAVIVPAVLAFYFLAPNMDLGWGSVLVIIFAVLAASAARFFYGLYFGFQLSAKLFIVSTGSATLNLIFVLLLLYWGTENPVIYAVATPAFLFAVSAFIIVPYLKKNFTWIRQKNSQYYGQILRMAGPIVFTTMLAPITLFYLRSYTNINLGEIALGMIQPGLQLVALIALLFSSFAGMTIVRWDQSKEAAFSSKQLLLLGAALAIPGFGIPIIFATEALQSWLITILFSKEFLPATATLPFFFAGEALRIGGFLLNQTFISKGLNWYTLIPKSFFALTIIICLHNGFGSSILEVAQAYCIGNFVFLILSILLFLYVQLHGLKSRPADQ